MSLYVGTSGWAYKEWKPDFYPADIPQSRFLEHYGRVLGACEVNATFYGLQKPATYTKWAEATPEDFRFSMKAHRALTHTKSIAPTEDKLGLLNAFLESVNTLGPRLGAVLFQFPPYRKRDDAAFETLLGALPEGIPWAFEFRHESWATPEIALRAAAAGGTICVSNTDGKVPESLPDGPLAYVRLRTERYTSEERDGWRALLERTSADRDVFAFAKHEGIPAGDPYGGIGLAQWLTATSGRERV